MPTPWDLPPHIRVKVRIDADSNCWLWTAAKTVGYGRIKHAGRIDLAHRVVYEMLQAGIPEGMQMDHLCWARSCVNPDHLEPVTASENMRRAVADIHSQPTYPCGHPRTDANTTIMRAERPTPSRSCRECQARCKREWRARQRAAA